MNGYLTLSSRYLSAHKKRTRLSILSISLSVALIVGIFSMLDVFLQFEKIQIINDFGNYHILIKNPTEAEKEAGRSRIDVENSGTWFSFKSGSINDLKCDIIALDENFAPNMGMNLLAGAYPKAENELMIESWAAEKLGAKVGDTVFFAFADGVKNHLSSAVYFPITEVPKRPANPAVVISMEAAGSAGGEKSNLLLIQFKDKADMKKAEQQIRESLGLTDDRVGRNERLLAIIGQSDYKAAVGLYETGAILFFIVLVAGVVMIYNTFNISVVERIRSFGLLRCIGASKAQIRRIVKREGFLLLRWALPIGIGLGMLATLFCCALLKYYNSYLFADIPLFTLSLSGILAGTVVGFATVFIATLFPAKKASKVSPVNAATGSSEFKVKKGKKQGVLTKLLPVETAMGIGSAVMKKRTFFFDVGLHRHQRHYVPRLSRIY
ncbi:hypothetical protein SDC9_43976 [bioreactor metagenome]|uniref:ABC3 transporter permease protein domain-containing protein n=1 Tax=bioreactor metagenome TaxID=1076179 RepID=A0A644W265_9ZZZZ